MPVHPLLLVPISGLGLASCLPEAYPARPARHCALVIPPPEVTRAPILEPVYRDGLPLAPGWLVILDHLPCD